MSSSWEDFDEVGSRNLNREIKQPSNLVSEKSNNKNDNNAKDGCNWGFDRQHGDDCDNRDDGNFASSSENTDSSKFIPIYEKYLENKETYSRDSHQTKHHNMYINNPQKALCEWFENEGNEFTIKTDQQQTDQFVCSIDIPLDEHDFTITSEVQKKKQKAIDEVCLIACKMLDNCDLLYSTWQQGSSNKDADFAALAAEKKRQFNEANKEDDIELDATIDFNRKKHCDGQTTAKNFQNKSGKSVSSVKINTYESLMADWKELNMSILMLKAKLVKLDLSITKANPAMGNKQNLAQQTNINYDDEEIDPLDEFMSTLQSKTQLSMDEKIEKTRIKSEISALESKQAEVSRLIELAKPSFNLNKISTSSTKVNNK